MLNDYKWQIGCGLLALCLILSLLKLSRASSELAAWQSKPATVQTVYVKEKCNQTVKVIYKDGSPCADVTAENGTETEASVIQTAKADCPELPNTMVWLGGGYYGAPLASLGVSYHAFKLTGLVGIGQYGGLAEYRLLSF